MFLEPRGFHGQLRPVSAVGTPAGEFFYGIISQRGCVKQSEIVCPRYKTLPSEWTQPDLDESCLRYCGFKMLVLVLSVTSIH